MTFQTLITETYQYVGEINDQKYGKGILIFNDGSVKTCQNNLSLSLTLQESSQNKNKKVNVQDASGNQRQIYYQNGQMVETVTSSAKYSIQQILVTPSYIYVGQLVNGQMSGSGTLVYNDGSFYTGKFVQNRFSGSGTFQAISGTTMNGQFKNGNINEGELQKYNQVDKFKIYEGNWSQYFTKNNISNKTLQDFNEQKQDINQKIHFVDLAKQSKEIVFYQGILKQASNQQQEQKQLHQINLIPRIQDYNSSLNDQITDRNQTLNILSNTEDAETFIQPKQQIFQVKNQSQLLVKQSILDNEQKLKDFENIKYNQQLISNNTIYTTIYSKELLEEEVKKRMQKEIEQIKKQFQESNDLEIQKNELYQNEQNKQQLKIKQEYEQQIVKLGELQKQFIQKSNQLIDIQHQSEIKDIILTDMEAKLKISEQNYEQATKSLEQYKVKYNQQTFQDGVQRQLESQRQKFIEIQQKYVEKNRQQEEIIQQQLKNQIAQLNDQKTQEALHLNIIQDKITLQAQIDNFSAQFKQQETKIQSYISADKILRQQLKEKETQIQNLEQREINLTAPKTAEFSTEEKNQFEQKVLELSKQLQECSSKNEQLQSQIKESQKEYESLNRKYEALEQEHSKCDQVKLQLSDCLSKNEDKVELQGQVIELKFNSVQNKYKKLEKEHSECEQLCSEKVKHEKQNLETNVQNNQMNQKQTEQDSVKLLEFEKLKTQYEILKEEHSKCKSLEQLLENKQLNANEKQTEDDQQKQELKTAKEEFENQKQKLSNENEFLKKQIQTEENKFVELKESFDELVKEHEKCDQNKLEQKQILEGLQEQLTKEQSSLKELKQQEQTQKLEINQLQQQLQDFQNKCTQNEELQKQVTNLNAEKNQTQLQATKLQKEIDKLTTEKQELSDNLAKYKKQIVDAGIQQNIQIYTKQHKEAMEAEQAKYKQLEQQLLDSQNKQPQDVTKQQQEQKYMIEDLQRQLKEESTKYSQLHKATQSNSTLKYYSNQADEYQKKLFQAQDEINQLKQNALQQDKQSQGSQLTRIQQKYDQLQKDKEKLQKEFDDKTTEIKKLKDQEKEFCKLMQQNNLKQNAQNEKLKTLVTNLLNEQKETEVKVKEMVDVFNQEKKTLLEKHALEMKNPEQYKINQDKAELESHKAGITEQLNKEFNLQLIAQKQLFDSQIQRMSQQNQSTMQNYQQQLQVYQQQLQACQVEKQNIQQNAQQYSVTIQNEAKQWIATETARITAELNNQQQQLKDEKQSLEVQITQLKLIVDKIPQIVTVNNIVIDLKEFPEDTGQKLVKKLEKQLPKMISAKVEEDRNIIVMVKQEDAEETAKIIKKLKIDDKRLNCQIVDQSPNQPVLESVINISVSESMIEDKQEQIKPIQEGQILIDLKDFPEDTAPKLIKTLKKQFPEMISADVIEDLNVLVTVKQEVVEETARTIRRLKIQEKKLTCTIINKDGKKDEKKKINTK
ncbi:MORN_motif [Hexamita inflata]|uniref:MORN motif n=1 Tax=Hexamita inflata TaxID=28002 RepID=A0AA86RR99_9EUKA|nr:MORN motif [Hexamita inflata]